MKLAELLILQLIRRQHNMIGELLDPSLLKQEIEELVQFYDVEIIAFFNSFSPRIWHHYCLLTPIPFGHGNLFFIVLIAIIDLIWVIGFSNRGVLLESGIPAHTLELAIECCHLLSQLT